MSTEPRYHIEAIPPAMDQAAPVLACPGCDQEMPAPEGCLPLHMSPTRVLCPGSGTPGAPPKFGQQIRAPLTIPDVAQFSVSEILASDACLSCGGPKAPGQPICKTCHGLLPFVHQKSLPDFMRGYLFADDTRKVAGHYDKSTFMEILKSALTELAALRGSGN
jgi:hypothetical protein